MKRFFSLKLSICLIINRSLISGKVSAWQRYIGFLTEAARQHSTGIYMNVVDSDPRLPRTVAIFTCLFAIEAIICSRPLAIFFGSRHVRFPSVFPWSAVSNL